MRPSCPGHAQRRVLQAGGRRLALLVDIDAHPMVELVAARLLLIVLDELRSEGIVIERVGVELDGRTGPGRQTPP